MAVTTLRSPTLRGTPQSESSHSIRQSESSHRILPESQVPRRARESQVPRRARSKFSVIVILMKLRADVEIAPLWQHALHTGFKTFGRFKTLHTCWTPYIRASSNCPPWSIAKGEH